MTDLASATPAPGPFAVRVWDPFVRIFHWSLVLGFAANALVLDDDGKLHQWVGYAIVGLYLTQFHNRVEVCLESADSAEILVIGNRAGGAEK